MKIKYPKTMHLPWSRGYTDDDKILRNTDHFTDRRSSLPRKWTGEHHDVPRFHSCEIAGQQGSSFPSLCEDAAWGIKHLIPEGYRLCGENVYAKHLLLYSAAVLLHAVLRVE